MSWLFFLHFYTWDVQSWVCPDCELFQVYSKQQDKQSHPASLFSAYRGVWTESVIRNTCAIVCVLTSNHYKSIASGLLGAVWVSHEKVKTSDGNRCFYPGSSSLSIRSLGSSFPREVWSLLAFSPPPGFIQINKMLTKR